MRVSGDRNAQRKACRAVRPAVSDASFSSSTRLRRHVAGDPPNPRFPGARSPSVKKQGDVDLFFNETLRPIAHSDAFSCKDRRLNWGTAMGKFASAVVAVPLCASSLLLPAPANAENGQIAAGVAGGLLGGMLLGG